MSANSRENLDCVGGAPIVHAVAASIGRNAAETIVRNVETPLILRMIEDQQAIQKRNAPSTIDWARASDVLHVLFAEMARRQSSSSTTPLEQSK